MHKAFNTRSVAITLTLFLAAVTGCSYGSNACPEILPSYALPPLQEPANVDMSLVTGEPCSPPCWQGLVPGKSTSEEVPPLLENTASVDESSIQHRVSHFEDLEEFYWQSSATNGQADVGRIIVHNGVVNSIFIQLEYELKLQNLVDIIGPPVGYFVIASTPPDAPMCHSYEIWFVWPDKGLSGILFFQLPKLVPSGEPLLDSDILFIESAIYSPSASTPQQYLVELGQSTSLFSCCFNDWEDIEAITMP